MKEIAILRIMKKDLSKKVIFGLVFFIFAINKTATIVLSGGIKYWQEWISILWFIIGAIVGAITLFGDRILDIYVVNPETKLAVFAKKYFAQGKNRDGIMILAKNKQLQRRLYMHSALFQVIWVVLAVFGIMSTNSVFGKGYILGLGLWLLLEEWEDYGKSKDYLKDWLFWQINMPMDNKKLKIYLVMMTVAWVGLFWRGM